MNYRTVLTHSFSASRAVALAVAFTGLVARAVARARDPSGKISGEDSNDIERYSYDSDRETLPGLSVMP